jgi:uroporphyrinogen decarboxylase
MGPRERVQLSLNHKESDRVPIDIGGSADSSINKRAYTDLLAFLGMPEEKVETYCFYQQTAYVSEAVRQRFGADVRTVAFPYEGQDLDIRDDGEYRFFVDKFGVTVKMPIDGGFFWDWDDHAPAISDCTVDALQKYRWPELDALVPIENVRRARDHAMELVENTDYALLGETIPGGGIFEEAARLSGIENFLVALIENPRYADLLMGAVTDLYVGCYERYLDEVGPYIDAIHYSDDLGFQQGCYVSPEVYRRLIKPKQRRLFDAIKRKTDAKIFFHSCGGVFDIIGDMIDIGTDILNPVQVSARGMDSKRLKSTFGKDIVFWGGGIDTQAVLPFGTPQQVRDEVKRRIDDFAPGGGFVFGAVHNIQAFVPPENIVAAFDAALEYGHYPRTAEPESSTKA